VEGGKWAWGDCGKEWYKGGDSVKGGNLGVVGTTRGGATENVLAVKVIPGAKRNGCIIVKGETLNAKLRFRKKVMKRRKGSWGKVGVQKKRVY